MGGAPRAQRQGLSHRRAQPAALHERRDGVRDLVRRRDRARGLLDVPEGRPARHRRRPLRVLALPDPGRPVLRAGVLPHGPAHDRRLLPQALRARRGADHEPVHHRVLPRLDLRADDRARTRVQRALGRRDFDAGRHRARRGRGARLHAVRRHVLGRLHRSLSDGDHCARDALPRLAARWNGRRRRRRDRARLFRRQVRVLAEARDKGNARLLRRLADRRSRRHPPAGRVPARDLGEGREDRRPRLDDRRGALLRVRVRADLPRLLGVPDRREDGRGAARGRGQPLPGDPADAHPSADAGVRAGDVLRRAALRDPLDRERRDARADGPVHRERAEAPLPAHERPPVPADAASRAGDLHARGRELRARERGLDLPDGPEHLQGHARLLHRAARRGNLLAPGDGAGRAAFDRARPGNVDRHGGPRRGFDLAAAARRARVLDPRHGRRLVRLARAAPARRARAARGARSRGAAAPAGCTAPIRLTNPATGQKQ